MKRIELRRGQETYSNPIQIIPKNVFVNIIGENSKYYKIKFNNRIGFVPIKEFKFNNKKIKLTNSSNALLYCKNEQGIVYSLSKKIYKSCGYKEISKSEFDKIKINKNNNKIAEKTTVSSSTLIDTSKKVNILEFKNYVLFLSQNPHFLSFRGLMISNS